MLGESYYVVSILLRDTVQGSAYKVPFQERLLRGSRLMMDTFVRFVSDS